MATSKTLATYCDYDPHNDTDTGFDWALYADGRVSAESRTRWQGGRDGRRLICEGAVDVAQIDEDDEDRDAESVLTALATQHRDNGTGPYSYDGDGAGFRQVRAGYVVS